MKELSKEQFIQILQDTEIARQEDIELFQTIYAFENHQAAASQVGQILGYKGKMPGSPINLQIGRLGKRIATKIDIQLTQRENLKYKYWDIFFDGWEEGKLFIWKLKKNLQIALEEINLTNEFFFADEISIANNTFFEGIKKTVTVNTYERNPQARRKCIEHWGLNCQICGFNFEENYGIWGKDFIHVHHIKPISEINKEYEIDPVKDLIPVCPNCHAMIHRQVTALTIEEIENKISNGKF